MSESMRPLWELAVPVTDKIVLAKDPERPYVGLEHLVTGSPDLAGWASASTSVSTNSVFERDDILFGKLRPNLRKAVLAGFAGYCSTDLLVLRASAEAEPGYLSKLFHSETVSRAAISSAIGTKMPRTSWKALKEVRVFAPPLPEQQQIAEILDTVDEAIRKTEQIIAKLEQVKQGLLHDLLTRGIDDNGELRDPDRHPEQFKDSELGRIPRGWEVGELGNVADVDRGKFTHRPRNDPRFYGGEYPFIQTGDVALAVGDLLWTFSQTLNARGVRVSRSYPAGSIAITIAANIADTAILGREMYFPDSVVAAVVRPPNVTRFVELCIRRAKRGLDARAPQSAQKNINLQDLRPLKLPLPSPDEQKWIEERYENLMGLLRSERQSAAKLRLLKAGLMEDLLTGCVRVPLAAASQTA